MVVDKQSADIQLIQQLAQGDPDAIRILVDRYSDAVYRFVYHQLGGSTQDTEDIVQETFVSALQAIHRFRGDSKLQTWLFSIAAHKVVDQQRRVTRRPQVALQDVESSLLTEEALPESVLENSEQRLTIRQSLLQLPPHYRTVLILKYVDDASVHDIAKIMKRSEKSIESILTRARRLLAKIFKGKYEQA